MRNLKIAGIVALAVGLLSGCGSMNSYLNNQHQTVEMYHVLDIKTREAPDTISDAIVSGLSRNTNSIAQSTPLQMGFKIPQEPGRFELINPLSALEGTAMGSFVNAQAGAAGTTTPRVAKCEGAVWTAKSVRKVPGSDNLDLYMCLYQYREGYNLNVYAVFKKVTGGLEQIIRSASDAVVGTPEEWVENTLSDTLEAVQGTNSKMTYLEGRPSLTSIEKLSIPRAAIAWN